MTSANEDQPQDGSADNRPERAAAGLSAEPESDTPSTPVPTSDQLSTLLDGITADAVSIGWLIEKLGSRSFGLTLFFMAVLALVPGASTVMAVLIAWPAIQMILGHDAPVLPGLLARRQISVAKLRRATAFLVPRLRWIEKLIRPRWRTGLQSTKRFTGVVMLPLGLTLASPFPFSHVIPALVMMLFALAYLEEDGIALAVSLIAALTSLAITGVALWGAIETADWLDRIWPD